MKKQAQHSYFKVLGLNIVVFSLAFLVSQGETLAAPKCSSVFFETVPIGALRPEFDHRVTYTKEISQTRITNQCKLGTCHLYAWSNHLEANYLRRTGAEIHLSADYLSYMHFLATSIEGLTRDNNDVSIKLGANPVKSFVLVRKYGLRPEGAFNIGSNFKAGAPSETARALVKNFVARVQLEMQKVYGPIKKQEIIQRRTKEIEELFGEMFGVFPKQFEFNGKSYDAKAFAAAYFPELTQKMIVYDVVHRPKGPFEKFLDSPTYDGYQIDRKNMDEIIISQIDQGKNVYLSYEHKHELVNKETGIMSIQAFNIPFKMLPLPQNRRAQFSLNDGGHAVQIVGYEVDPITQNIIKVKVKNSWGETTGDSGYYHMYRDYLHAFVQRIVVVP